MEKRVPDVNELNGFILKGFSTVEAIIDAIDKAEREKLDDEIIDAIDETDPYGIGVHVAARFFNPKGGYMTFAAGFRVTPDTSYKTARQLFSVLKGKAELWRKNGGEFVAVNVPQFSVHEITVIEL